MSLPHRDVTAPIRRPSFDIKKDGHLEDSRMAEVEIARVSIELVQKEKERISMELSGVTSQKEEPKIEVRKEEVHKIPGQDEPLPEHNLEVGLTDAQVEELRKKWGYNEIVEKKTPLWKQVLWYFISPMSILMEVAAILAGVVQSWPDFGVILGLLFINGAVQFGEEHQAGNAVAALQKQLALRARVLRNGKWDMIETRELVPGDTIRVKVGDIVPSDAMLMGGGGVVVDQAALTGESLPVDKDKGDIILSSSGIKHGDMTAVVTKTGGHTFFGRAATLVGQKRKPGRIEMLVTAIARFLIILTFVLVIIVIAVQAAVPLAAGETTSSRAATVLQFATLVIIAGIPLGLNAVLSVTMAVGVRVMARNKVIVSRLTAIEDLAGMDILCSDKTGTLTKNELTLGEPVLYQKYTKDDLKMYAALASQLDDGDVMDSAVDGWIGDRDIIKGCETIKFIPFDAVIKRTEAVVRFPDNRVVRISKGAVHKIEKLIADGTAPTAVKAIVPQMTTDTDLQALKGIRCLAVAIAENESDWQPVGMLTLFDPPRDDAAHTIKTVNHYGVMVKMITGDTVAIGRETARRLRMNDDILNADTLAGIEVMDRVRAEEEANACCEGPRRMISKISCCADDEENKPKIEIPKEVKGAPKVATGGQHEAAKLHAAEVAPVPKKSAHDIELLTTTCENVSGFAQMLPEHKYIVVDLLQSRGHVVAMTGDGVNDAPALKRADVGIAVSGATDAARMAASLVLQEPGLSVIVEAVKESRRIFARMESYVIYRINATLELLFFLVLSATILDFRITGIQIVFLVLVNDITVMLIAIDHVSVRPFPLRWHLAYLTTISAFIGAFSVAIVMTTLVVLKNYYGYPIGVLQTALFLQLSITDQLTIVSTRTRGLFFFSMPHPYLLGACILTQVLFTLFAIFGFGANNTEMPAMPGDLIGVIWGLGLAGIVVKDLAKILVIWILDKIFKLDNARIMEVNCESFYCCVKAEEDNWDNEGVTAAQALPEGLVAKPAETAAPAPARVADVPVAVQA